MEDMNMTTTKAQRFILKVDGRREVEVSVPENPVCGARPECCEKHEDLHTEMLDLLKFALARFTRPSDADIAGDIRALLARIGG
jgi:hypothetical protein